VLSEEDYNILRLIRSKNVGNRGFFKILDFLGSFDEAFKHIDLFNKKYCPTNPITIAPKEKIDKEIESCSKIGAQIISYKNDYYSRLLLEIYDFPPILTVLGNKMLLNQRSISIVGSRAASANGCNFAKILSAKLSGAGFIITSGMARGIDSSAHKGVIDSNSHDTIAVLGGGIDNIYPKENSDLYHSIKDGGLIVSEMPFGTEPRAENFPSRNRIVSGLSEAVVIIEASLKSGTLHTARQAIEQNRELFVAPGNPYDYRAEGSNKLLKDGAILITSVEDILDNLRQLDKTQKPKQTELDLNTTNKSDKIDKNTTDCSNLGRLILSKLNTTPILINILCKDLSIDINTLNSELIKLELEGKITIKNNSVMISSDT